ncbi:MAG: histidine phosphatase family protein [Kiloniellales bacterium]|nr:histidine phosphatase family protein [Kiloniellales bacterium]
MAQTALEETPEDGPRSDGKPCLKRFGPPTAVAALVLVVCAFGLPDGAAADDGAAWAGLRSGGHVALIRHALAPGTGDPAAFRLGDCSTQRNLSDEGRAQAARIGARFRAEGIGSARVYSSQWCRCLETAELLALGPVEALLILNSFYERRENEDRQTRALEAWLAGQDHDRPVVLITHQVNITALTGVFPSSGEMVVIRRSEDGRISVVGSIETE